jgi:hypothetical protein
MALTIICVTGPPSSGKSSTIRDFTAKHLKYNRANGDVLGVFPVPRRNYAAGVSSYGDNLKVVREGLNFLRRYRGLTVMIVACHSEGSVTYRQVDRFAKRVKVRPILIETIKLNDKRERKTAIRVNVAKIKRLMPPRQSAN